MGEGRGGLDSTLDVPTKNIERTLSSSSFFSLWFFLLLAVSALRASRSASVRVPPLNSVGRETETKRGRVSFRRRSTASRGSLYLTRARSRSRREREERVKLTSRQLQQLSTQAHISLSRSLPRRQMRVGERIQPRSSLRFLLLFRVTEDVVVRESSSGWGVVDIGVFEFVFFEFFLLLLFLFLLVGGGFELVFVVLS